MALAWEFRANLGNSARLRLKTNKKFSSSMRKTLKGLSSTLVGVGMGTGTRKLQALARRPSDPHDPGDRPARSSRCFLGTSGVGAFCPSSDYAQTCLEFSDLKAGTALLLFLGTLLNKQTAPYPSTPP